MSDCRSVLFRTLLSNIKKTSFGVFAGIVSSCGEYKGGAIFIRSCKRCDNCQKWQGAAIGQFFATSNASSFMGRPAVISRTRTVEDSQTVRPIFSAQYGSHRQVGHGAT